MLTTLAVVLCAIAYVRSHNWTNGPSRTGDGISRSQKASTVKPLPPSSTGNPQVQVRAGQPFQVEWVIGHNRHTYLIMVAKKDEKELAKHDARNTLLDNYFKEAPAEYQGRPKGMFQKFHRQQGTQNVFDPPPRGQGDKRVDPDPINNFFQRRVPPNDPLHVTRDPIFRGSFRGASRNIIDPDDVMQFQYKDSQTASDRWAVYKNDKYPWIIGGGKWLHFMHMPTRPDFAMMQFPANTPPGDYIIQYRWSGFYDAIDVRIIDAATDVANPYGAEVELVPGAPPPPPDSFKKINHCDFPQNTRIGSCRKLTLPGGNPQACIDDCLGKSFDECNGVLVVPIKNEDTVWSGFRDLVNIPFGNGCAKPTDGSTHVCYALKSRAGTQLDAEYWATSDTEDPAFYSSCYFRVKNMGFAPAPPAAPEPIEWEYRGKCIKCSDREEYSRECVTPSWKLQDSCANCDEQEFKPDACAVAPPANGDVVTCNNAVWYADGASNRACGSLNNNKQINFNGAASQRVTGGEESLRTPGGTNDYIRMNSFDTTKLGDKVTFSLWMRIGAIRNDAVLITQSNPSSNPSDGNTHFGIFMRSNNGNPRIRVRMKVSNGNARRVDIGRNLVLNRWHHIAVTYDGAKLLTYIDGQLRDTENVNGAFRGHASWPVMLGRNANSGTYRANAAYREISMLSRALSAADVRKLYDQTK